MTVQTQWRYAGDPAARVGLDLGAVMAVMPALGIAEADRAETLSRLQVMEIEALGIFNRRRDAELAKLRNKQRQSAAQMQGRRPR